jgi:hypothetical protein
MGHDLYGRFQPAIAGKEACGSSYLVTPAELGPGEIVVYLDDAIMSRRGQGTGLSLSPNCFASLALA